MNDCPIRNNNRRALSDDDVLTHTSHMDTLQPMQLLTSVAATLDDAGTKTVSRRQRLQRQQSSRSVPQSAHASPSDTIDESVVLANMVDPARPLHFIHSMPAPDHDDTARASVLARFFIDGVDQLKKSLSNVAMSDIREATAALDIIFTILNHQIVRRVNERGVPGHLCPNGRNCMHSLSCPESNRHVPIWLTRLAVYNRFIIPMIAIRNASSSNASPLSEQTLASALKASFGEAGRDPWLQLVLTPEETLCRLSGLPVHFSLHALIPHSLVVAIRDINNEMICSWADMFFMMLTARLNASGDHAFSIHLGIRAVCEMLSFEEVRAHSIELRRMMFQATTSPSSPFAATKSA